MRVFVGLVMVVASNAQWINITKLKLQGVKLHGFPIVFDVLELSFARVVIQEKPSCRQ